MKILFWALVFMVIYQFFIKPARKPVEPKQKQEPRQTKQKQKQKLTDVLPTEDIDFEEID